jgi:1-pyrroline-5-carboxylate dehydrogenase
MSNSVIQVPAAANEPVGSYAPGTPERAALQDELKRQRQQEVEIPLIIGGEEVRTGETGECRIPHDHGHLLGRYHKAGPEQVARAAEAAREAWKQWSELDWRARAAIFLRMAELLSGERRMQLNAATMLAQSKTPHQAEIDSACELIDFFRFNTAYMRRIYTDQPDSAPGTWNYVEYRALEGFVFAVTPFNFASIAGNLPTSPALMGNTVLWKPASSAVYTAYHMMRLFEEAGLPPGVINFLPGSGGEVGGPVLTRPDLAGVHFTGSTRTFQAMWRTIGGSIQSYRTYPRIVGETGGKDFVFAHASADPEAVSANLLRGAFEYQGQKCSAVSRAYVPDSLWPSIKERLLDEVATLKMGDIADFTTFMGAVIDEAAFDSIESFIDYAREAKDAEILCGGGCDKSKGYFVEPTVVLADDPHFKLMEEEIFGPVLTIYVYPEKEYEETLQLCDETSMYGLTGAIFARDRYAVERAYRRLRHAAGNFYINDKPTGAVVGQQPFGGSRGSGTNDKAGSALNLMRWVSMRTVKEALTPVTDYRYPYMEDE